MPRNSTLESWGIDRTVYEALQAKADKALETSTKNMAVFKLPGADITPAGGLRLYKNIGTWVSMRSLIDEYGVIFDSDTLGMPKVRLITKDQVTVNGVTTFAFLHYLVQSEHPRKDGQTEEEYRTEYLKRLSKLQEIFVTKDGGVDRLIVAGKYFATARFTAAQDDQFLRNVILEPSDEMSYL
jgi:hypothetical protein